MTISATRPVCWVFGVMVSVTIFFPSAEVVLRVEGPLSSTFTRIQSGTSPIDQFSLLSSSNECVPPSVGKESASVSISMVNRGSNVSIGSSFSHDVRMISPKRKNSVILFIILSSFYCTGCRPAPTFRQPLYGLLEVIREEDACRETGVVTVVGMQHRGCRFIIEVEHTDIVDLEIPSIPFYGVQVYPSRNGMYRHRVIHHGGIGHQSLELCLINHLLAISGSKDMAVDAHATSSIVDGVALSRDSRRGKYPAGYCPDGDLVGSYQGIVSAIYL